MLSIFFPHFTYREPCLYSVIPVKVFSIAVRHLRVHEGTAWVLTEEAQMLQEAWDILEWQLEARQTSKNTWSGATLLIFREVN